MEIKEDIFKAIIRPNSQDNEITCFDKEKGAYLIKVNAKAEDNKANIELIKFLSKALGRKARIKSGLKSREKIIQTYK